jgi:hypothetical protein
VPHPQIENPTGLVVEALILADEETMPLAVPLVQGTWHIGEGGSLSWLPKQPPLRPGGEWYGDPATTSQRLEPQAAFIKPMGTDIVLLGDAHAPQRGATEGQVGVRVGSVRKVARVLGDRRLVRGLAGLTITPPAPFERIPIVAERAFGGWDRRHEDALRHRCEWRNPVGVGFFDAALPLEGEAVLPNFELPEHPFRAFGDAPPPACFGFVSPDWEPRRSLAGTYDEAWSKTRKPLLARDFDRRFFQSASAGLTTQGHLLGDEEVVVIGASPEPRVAFQLPASGTLVCELELRSRGRMALQPLLDTVIIDMGLRMLTLQWRAHLPLPRGPHDLRSVGLRVARAAMPAASA